MKPKNKLIVAIDVDTERKALRLVDELKGVVGMFKIGFELFTSCGPGIIKKIASKRCGIFLDLKFHDIPNTVSRAALSAMCPGVYMFNVHASGGYDMMKKTAEAVKDKARRDKITPPKILAVTVLTSMDQIALNKVGVSDSMKIQVLRLANLAKDAGLDGVVASPEEIKIIRKSVGKNFLIVTPGVRPLWASVGDQKRVATPELAVKDGADFIVVGRPITEASDPASAAKDILKEII